MNNIVSVSGFGWSGSGAVIDLLSEYEDLEIFARENGDTHEISLLCEKDGIYDLDFYLNTKWSRIGSSDAIISFRELLSFLTKKGYENLFNGKFMKLSEAYLDSLIDYSFDGWTFRDERKPAKGLKKVVVYNNIIAHIFANRWTRHIPQSVRLKKKLSKKVYHKIEVSYRPDSFDKKTREYITSLFSAGRRNADIPLVVDQFYPADNPRPFMKYLPESKVIIVRRDPIDTYLLAKCALDYFKVPLPIDNVNDYVTYYREVIGKTRIEDNDTVLSVQFEDLIYKYDETVKIIESFLGVSKHTNKMGAFDPKVSINNTQLVTRYPQYHREVEFIRKELAPYLYDFGQNQFERKTSKVF